MSNISEIIERLENIAKHAVHYVGEPPFIMSLNDGIALHEAIDLLKAQEPRVMTLEEVKAMKRYTICAVEQQSKVLHTTFNAEYRGTLTIGERNYLDFGLYADVSPFRRSEGGYGKTWRCWTSRPTDEQREATPWTQTNGL